MRSAGNGATTSTSSPPLWCKGENRHEAYEDTLETGIGLIETYLQGGSVLDPAKVLKWAEDGGIPRRLATDNLRLLDRAGARGMAGYLIEMVNHLKPLPRPAARLTTLFFSASRIETLEQRFAILVDELRLQGPVANPVAVEDDKASDGISPGDDLSIKGAASFIAEPDVYALKSLSELPLAEVVNSPDVGKNSARPHLPPVVQDTEDPIAALVPIPSISAIGGSTRGAQRSPLEPVEGNASLGPELVAPDAAPVVRFSAYWADFVNYQMTSKTWKESRQPELAGTLRLVVRLIGDVPILTLTRDQASLLRDRIFS